MSGSALFRRASQASWIRTGSGRSLFPTHSVHLETLEIIITVQINDHASPMSMRRGLGMSMRLLAVTAESAHAATCAAGSMRRQVRG